MSIAYFSEYLLTKLWALFHDPPHKAILITKRKNHEEEAEKIFKSLGWGVEKFVKRNVRLCDYIASTIDRWCLIAKLEVGENEIIKSSFLDILNIFNPEIEAYKIHEMQLNINEIIENTNKYVDELRMFKSEILDQVDDVLKYHVLFSCLEYLWAKCSRYVSPADTRFPTHTVFDHNYAVATAVNWYIKTDLKLKSLSEFKSEHDLHELYKPYGYFVVVDFPAIQEFVNKARKATDYWAGSFLVSYLMFETVERFLYILGPDIMLLPTARHNLMYKFWLLNKIAEQCEEQYALRILEKFIEIWSVQPGYFHPTIEPVIPGTISLVLPKAKLRYDLKIETELYKEFNKVNEALENTNKLKASILENFCQAWNNISTLYEKLNGSDVVSRFIIKLMKREELRNIITETHPPAPRIIIIEVDKEYDRLKEDSKLKSILMKHLEKLNALGFNLTIEELYGKIFYHILFTKLLSFRIVKTRYRESLITRPISKLLQEVNTIYERRLRNEAQEVSTWHYCTTCGDNPAIIRFSRDEDRNGYRKSIQEIMKESVSDAELEELKRHFKPGENLCPYCLIKRILRFIISYARIFTKLSGFLKSIPHLELIPRIPTVDHVANSIVIQFFKEIYDKEKDSLEKIIKERLPEELARKFINVIKRDKEEREFSFEDYGKTITEVKRILDPLFKEIFMMSVKLCRDGRKEICEILQKYSPYISYDECKVRTYYVIIKGDGDSIGKLLMGKLFDKPAEYVEKIKGKITNYINVGKELYEKLLDEFSSLVNDLNDYVGKETTIILTPTYHMTMSAALMITAINDIKLAREAGGLVIYAGGDDVVLLTPIESAFDALIKTRANYWAIYTKLFHGEHGIKVAAPIVYGRSYGIRIAHVMDPMQTEIDIVTKLLEDYAKDTKWNVVTKDTVAISYGRTSLGELINIVKLPLSSDSKNDVSIFIEFLKKLWIMILNDKLSHGLPIDFENMYKDAIRSMISNKQVIDKNTSDTIKTLIERLVRRNVRSRIEEEKIIEEIRKLLDKIVNVIEISEKESISLIEHLMNGLKILRGFPR